MQIHCRQWRFNVASFDHLKMATHCQMSLSTIAINYCLDTRSINAWILDFYCRQWFHCLPRQCIAIVDNESPVGSIVAPVAIVTIKIPFILARSTDRHDTAVKISAISDPSPVQTPPRFKILQRLFYKI